MTINIPSSLLNLVIILVLIIITSSSSSSSSSSTIGFAVVSSAKEITFSNGTVLVLQPQLFSGTFTMHPTGGTSSSYTFNLITPGPSMCGFESQLYLYGEDCATGLTTAGNVISAANGSGVQLAFSSKQGAAYSATVTVLCDLARSKLFSPTNLVTNLPHYGIGFSMTSIGACLSRSFPSPSQPPTVIFNNGTNLTLQPELFTASFKQMTEQTTTASNDASSSLKSDWDMSLAYPSTLGGICVTPIYVGKGSVCQEVFFQTTPVVTPNSDGSGVLLIYDRLFLLGGHQQHWQASIEVVCDLNSETLSSSTNSYHVVNPTFVSFLLKSKGACLSRSFPAPTPLPPIIFENRTEIELQPRFFSATFNNMKQLLGTGDDTTNSKHSSSVDWDMSLVAPSSFDDACVTPIYVGKGHSCNDTIFINSPIQASPNQDGTGVLLVYERTVYNHHEQIFKTSMNIICNRSHHHTPKLASPSNSYSIVRDSATNVTHYEFTLSSYGACLTNCSDLTNEATCKTSSSDCSWCENYNLCVNSTTHYPLVPSSFGVCQCGVYSSSKSMCESIDDCEWESKILVGVSQEDDDSHEYCSAKLRCASPLTCEGLNTANPPSQLETSCLASGCSFNGALCVSGACFNFFLPSFVSQPFLLLFLGFAKDIFVLLLIGAVGDRIGRYIQNRTIGITMWWKEWSEEKLEIRLLDQTIYLIDDECCDGYGWSFEEYCDHVCEQSFELKLSGESQDEDDNQDDENHEAAIDNINSNTQAALLEQHKQSVRDAVSFALFDSGLWIDLKKDEDDQEDQRASPDTKANLNNNNASDEESLSPRNEEETSLLSKHRLKSSFLIEHDKVILDSSTFSSKVKLQEVVEKAIIDRATAIVFYAHSRDQTTRMASALNSFPSLLQLVFYCVGIAFMFSFGLYSVVFKNKENVERVAETVCSDSSSSSTPSSNNSTDFDGGGDDVISSLAQATYFLLGFRLMNASTLATAMLVFVKVMRGLYQKYSGKLPSLSLTQRLPLVSLYSNKYIHLLLIFYAALVFPFCWAGPLYGWYLAKECMYPPAIGLAALLLNALTLKGIRYYFTRRDRNDDDEGAVPPTESSSLLDFGDSDKKEQQHAECNFLRGVSSRDNAPDDEQHPIGSSIQGAAPHDLWRALLVFLLTEEIPTIILTIALQTSFNYLSLLEYQYAFGLSASDVIEKDFNSRKLECIWLMIEKDISGAISALSSVVAFF